MEQATAGSRQSAANQHRVTRHLQWIVGYTTDFPRSEEKKKKKKAHERITIQEQFEKLCMRSERRAYSLFSKLGFGTKRD